MRFVMPKTSYIPAGATKVTPKDKEIQAEVYFYNTAKGEPALVAFAGKSQKPVMRFRFSSEEARAKRMLSFFDGQQKRLEQKKERAANRKNAARGLEIGDVVYTSWGYDQTNTEFFQVTDLIGKRMVELREIASSYEATGYMQGNREAVKDEFIGDPIKRQARNGAVKICDTRSAWLWDGRSKGVSSYA